MLEATLSTEESKKQDDILVGKDGQIRCIFLSEFHATAGSKISCQVVFFKNLLISLINNNCSIILCFK